MTSANRTGCRRRVGPLQAVALAGVALLLMLGGCSTMSALNPVDWWHSLEGGPIAEARPPPPNADAPYPSLASVPDRPQVNDAAARGQIANALIADRANAQYDASIAPLAPPGSPPAPSAPPPPPAAGQDASNATLAAASAAPPPPPARPQPAPRAAVQATPLPAPAVAAPATGPAQTAAGALPDMPQSPPAPPSLPGAPQIVAPTPPTPTPPPVVRPPTPPVAGAPAPVAFPPGSALLPTTAYPALKAMAQQRGGGSIAVVGFGAAADSAPATQAAAMPLALDRARAIAAYLETAGVPAAAIRIDAEAMGQGGAARLIH